MARPAYDSPWRWRDWPFGSRDTRAADRGHPDPAKCVADQLDHDAGDAKHPWIMPQCVPIVDPVDVLIGEFNICALQVSSARAGRSCQQRHRARRRRCCRGRGSNNSIGGQPQAPLPLDGHLRRASHPPARRIQTIAWGFECPRCRQSCARSDAPAKMSSLLQND